MRAKYVNINEEILGRFISSGENKAIMFKNPPSIRRLASSCRAIIDMDGNLYIAELDDENSSDDERNNFLSDVTHTDIINYLCKNRNLKGWKSKEYTLRSKTGGWMAYKNLSAWQRFNKTNQFYLAESYMPSYLSNLDNINEIKRCMENTNRPDIEFIYESIYYVNK
jgi:hypothetical protein